VLTNFAPPMSGRIQQEHPANTEVAAVLYQIGQTIRRAAIDSQEKVPAKSSTSPTYHQDVNMLKQVCVYTRIRSEVIAQC
jgi:hypothetical protein